MQAAPLRLGNTDSGTGNANLQIFEILSGGRTADKPIPEIEGSDPSA